MSAAIKAAMRTAHKIVILLCCLGLALSVHASTPGAFTPEQASTRTLPANTGQQWFWLSGSRGPSFADGQAYLYNQNGERLGQLSTGYWFNSLVNAPKRNEIITVETYFSRGTRGQRKDFVVLYDAQSLNVKKEIEIPPKRISGVRNSGFVNLSEDERFLIVVNYTPAQSISIVDLSRGRFVEEVETPGCSVPYAGAGRSFYAICGNGGFMRIKLGEDGRVVSRTRSKPLFDPVDDFLTISATRIGNTWYFVSRNSNVYAIAMDADRIELLDKWSLSSEQEREDNWMISGFHHTASHQKRAELYVLMQQGDEHGFEEPGSHVWVYDVNTKRKIREIELDELAISIDVDQSDKPRLYTLNFHFPIPWLFQLWLYISRGEAGLMEIARQRSSVYDAAQGKHLFDSELVPHGGFVLNVQAW
ncbi:MAG: hypothetical protein OIF35_12995 [Cellvibrionaceae bacterium]|nr:hypothetical protein [Cellvibrionaceae bacterium]